MLTSILGSLSRVLAKPETKLLLIGIAVLVGILLIANVISPGRTLLNSNQAVAESNTASDSRLATGYAISPLSSSDEPSESSTSVGLVGTSSRRATEPHGETEGAFSEEWYSSETVGRLANFHGLSAQEILSELVDEHGLEWVEMFQGANIGDFAPFAEAQATAARNICDYVLGSEIDQSERFLREILGDSADKYLREKFGAGPHSERFEQEYYSLLDRLTPYEGQYVYYCNEIRAAVESKVRSGGVEMQPYIIMPKHGNHAVDLSGKDLHFAVAIVTPKNWSLSFALFRGEYPSFDQAAAAWGSALTKAKASLE